MILVLVFNLRLDLCSIDSTDCSESSELLDSLLSDESPDDSESYEAFLDFFFLDVAIETLLFTDFASLLCFPVLVFFHVN